MKLSSRDFVPRRLQGKALPGEIVDMEVRRATSYSHACRARPYRLKT